MKLQVRFFATLKERAGVERLTLELPEMSSVSQLITTLSDQFPALRPALPSALIAVNQEYAFPDSALNNGDEVAIFPPVSGGSTEDWPEYFAVTNDQLDVDAIIQLITRPETGAVAVFAGAVRGMTHKPGMPEITSHLYYEAYEPMANKMLRQVAAEIRERYPKVQGIAAVQRLGHLNIGETTILVACSSGHRNDGIFEAAHYGINRVKEIVPVWKKEVGPTGEVWIEGDYHPTPSDVSSSQKADEFEIGCTACDERYPLVTTHYLCKCGSPLEFIKSPAFDTKSIEVSQTSMWRYRRMLAPADITPATLGEGWTPLVEVPSDSGQLYAKLEFLNPSGSFKDRGLSLLTSVLNAHGIKRIHDDSSGNAGASLAMYSARSQMQATLFVPAAASPSKLAQIELYGAQLKRIEGSRSNTTDAAVSYRKESYYASHVFHPLPMLGYKSTAWELWEQLGESAPDIVIVPVGQGSQLIGLFDGFRDLLNAGLIDHIPRMIGVQALNCAPIWQQAHKLSDPQSGKTIAEGIRVMNPIRMKAVLAAISDSQGQVIAVSEEQIIDGFTQLARRGIFVEPTSAVVWGAWKQIEGSISKDDTIVLIMSGAGLKSANLEQLTHLVRSQSST